jgi:hypothetical protein
VIKVLSNLAYVIEPTEGNTRAREVAHISRLHRYKVPVVVNDPFEQPLSQIVIKEKRKRRVTFQEPEEEETATQEETAVMLPEENEENQGQGQERAEQPSNSKPMETETRESEEEAAPVSTEVPVHGRRSPRLAAKNSQ